MGLQPSMAIWSTVRLLRVPEINGRGVTSLGVLSTESAIR